MCIVIIKFNVIMWPYTIQPIFSAQNIIFRFWSHLDMAYTQADKIAEIKKIKTIKDNPSK